MVSASFVRGACFAICMTLAVGILWPHATDSATSEYGEGTVGVYPLCNSPFAVYVVDGDTVVCSEPTPTMCPHCWEEGIRVEKHGIGEASYELEQGMGVSITYESYWYEYRCPNRHLYVVNEESP